MRTKTKVILALVVLLAAFGCSEIKNNGTGSSASFDSIYSSSFTTCMNCHVPGGSAQFLDLSTASAAHTSLLARVTNPSSPTTCTNQFRVVAGNPSASFLLAVLFSDYNSANFNGEAGCTGSVAHHGYSNLSASEKSSLVQWIQSGAAR